MKCLLSLAIIFISFYTTAQTKAFRFAFISDTHIGSPNGGAEEDLRRTVADINSMNDIAFVVVTGDITELGTDRELQLAKQILDSLDVPYYIIPGNHDTGWSESGGLGFTKTFGYDKFFFKHKGVYFIGCPSGPYVRMSDGHVPGDAMNWMKEKLKKLKKNDPVVFLNHYPLDAGLDNWYEVVDMLKKKNTILALCGHGHNNRTVKAEDIPAVMGGSNLRAKETEGGYNLVDVRKDSILFIVRRPLSKTEKLWTGVKNEKQDYDLTKKFPRPDFSINQQYSNVKPVWMYSSDANVISTPVVLSTNDYVVFGNQNGKIEALDLETGKLKWTYKTGGPIFSSPTELNGEIAVGSTDGHIYYLNENGKLLWKLKTGAAVLGSPVIDNHTIFIGSSDHRFRGVSIEGRQVMFSYDSLKGPVTSKPVIYKNVVLFGAWDTYLYAFDLSTKQLKWKWNNGSSLINYSPAACIPVVHDDVVYVVAPDRFLSAIEINTGKTLWRTKEATVRESIGISEDGKLIYGKTMQDTVVAFRTNKEKPELAWKMHVGYGYEHSPSMLIEKNGKVYFGTRNGVVYCINPSNQKIVWAYKIDNSMVNTVNVLDNKQIIASTMDGKIGLLREE